MWLCEWCSNERGCASACVVGNARVLPLPSLLNLAACSMLANSLLFWVSPRDLPWTDIGVGWFVHSLPSSNNSLGRLSSLLYFSVSSQHGPLWKPRHCCLLKCHSEGGGLDAARLECGCSVSHVCSSHVLHVLLRQLTLKVWS